jgi:anti-anti-sigma factor
MSTAIDTALVGSLTIPYAIEQHTLLRDAMAAGTSVLDLGGITECDTSGVQLLLAATRRAQSQHVHLELRNASGAVRDTLQRYGLESLLSKAQST